MLASYPCYPSVCENAPVELTFRLASNLCLVIGCIPACQFLPSRAIRNMRVLTPHRFKPLPEPCCCSCRQEQPYSDDDNPDGSCGALAVRGQPFGSDCCRDKSHY